MGATELPGSELPLPAARPPGAGRREPGAGCGRASARAFLESSYSPFATLALEPADLNCLLFAFCIIHCCAFWTQRLQYLSLRHSVPAIFL